MIHVVDVTGTDSLSDCVRGHFRRTREIVEEATVFLFSKLLLLVIGRHSSVNCAFLKVCNEHEGFQ